jgi:cell division protein FtsL
VNTIRQVRAAALPAHLWLPDLGRWAFRAAVLLFCLASTLLLTAVRLEITRLRYELSDLHRQRETLAAQVARLEVEAGALASPKRIEEKAKAAGFVYPDRESIVVLDE